MKKENIWIIYVIIGLFLLMLWRGKIIKDGNLAMEPDVVSSININRNHYLTVIANCNTIENKEEFAWKLIEMCRDNSFRTMKFSTDKGYACSINMKVYLQKSDISRHEPEMLVEYEPVEYSQRYDFMNDPEQFELYVDGIKVK